MEDGFTVYDACFTLANNPTFIGTGLEIILFAVIALTCSPKSDPKGMLVTT